MSGICDSSGRIVMLECLLIIGILIFVGSLFFSFVIKVLEWMIFSVVMLNSLFLLYMFVFFSIFVVIVMVVFIGLVIMFMYVFG